MTILISSSYRFIDKWDEIKRILEKSDLKCVTPKDIDIELFDKFENLSKEETKIAHDKYFEYLRSSDVLYVLDYDGYIGKSMMIEIGYVKGLEKRIFAIEEAHEPTAQVFINKIIKPDKIAGEVDAEWQRAK